MNRVLRKVYKSVFFIKAHILYYMDKRKYMEEHSRIQSNSFAYSKKDKWPIYYDRFKEAGDMDPHYFLQDIFMASYVIENCKSIHYDIGSRVDGFISHLLSSGIAVSMIDVRPFPYKVDGLSFVQGDATNLDSIEDNSLDSLSSLHAIEHFGLGRYGDPIDPNAWKKALKAMERVVKPKGTLLISVPVGNKDVLHFNAHRVFKISSIPNQLSKFKLERAAYIYNYKVIDVDPLDIESVVLENEYCCGLYVFKKL